MNLDFYLEKDILRRVKFLEYLYHRKTCEIPDLIDDLKVSLQTLRNDFKRLSHDLEGYIDVANFDKYSVTMTFKMHFPLDQLTQIVYKDSKFTRILYRTLNGDYDYNSMSQKEFISTSNVYKITNNINLFLTELDIPNNELRYRLLMNDIFTKIDFADEYIIEEVWEEARHILDHLIDEKTIYVHSFDYDIIVMNIYLALTRAEEHPLIFDIQSFQLFEDECVYQELCEYYREAFQTPYYKQEAAITTMIYIQHVNYKEYVLAQTAQQKHWMLLTQLHTPVYYLYLQCMSLEQKPIIDELALQRTFERLLFNSWVGLPIFTPHYLIREDDYNYQRFCQLFIRWGQDLEEPIQLQERNLSAFYHLFHNTSLSHANYYTCNIVTTSQDRFTLFFNFFYQYLSSSQFKINSTIFYSMDELPNEIFQFPYIIICDRELEDHRFQNAENIFYFSPDTLRHDVKHLLNCLLNNVMSEDTKQPE